MKNCYSEGECQIKKIVPLKFNKKRLVLFLIFGPLSGFILWTTSALNKKLLKFLVFEETNLENSEYFYVLNSDGK